MLRPSGRRGSQHFANTSLGILQRRNPEAYARLTPQELNPAEFGFSVSPESLSAVKSVISLCLAGREAGPGDSAVVDDAQTEVFVEVFAGLFTFFAIAVSEIPREGTEGVEN